MATIASTEEVKAYLQVTTDTDDDLIETLLTGVEAIISKNLKSIIAAAEETTYLDGGFKHLLLPNTPVSVDTEDTLVIFDTITELTLDEDTYRLIPETGEIFPNGVSWVSLYGDLTSTEVYWPQGSRRFKVTYTGGLSLRSDYDDFIVNQIKIAEFLWVTDFYSHRQASSSSEKIDVFVENYLLTEEMPARVKSALFSLLDNTNDL